MKKLYVITHDTYAQGLTADTSDLDNLASLAVGAFAIINKDPDSANFDKVVNAALAVASIATVPTLSAFQIAYMGNHGLELSPILYSHLTKAKKVSDASAAAKVVTIGNTTDGGTTYAYHLPTITAGMSVGFIVTNTSKPVENGSRNRYYTYTTVAGDTAGTITAALVAIVNADAKRIVTASLAYAAATDGITLTGRTAGVPFEVSMVGIFKDADLTIGTNYASGIGLAADLLDLEADYRVELGDTNVLGGDPAFDYTSRITAGEEYILTILNSTVPTLREPNLDQRNFEQQIILAVPDGSTNTDAAGYTLTAINRLLDKIILATK